MNEKVYKKNVLIWVVFWEMWTSVQFSSVVSDSLQPHEPQHARPPCPLPTPRVHPNPCPLNQWCHPTISSSVIPFSSCLQSFLASGSFQMSQLFKSGVQSTGVSALASLLPMNIQDWFPLGWIGWISLQSKGLSAIFKMDNQQGPTVEHRELCSILCGSLDGRALGRTDECVGMTESLCCSPETTTALLTSYIPIQKKKLNV